jgi:hypothetical protein
MIHIIAFQDSFANSICLPLLSCSNKSFTRWTTPYSIVPQQKHKLTMPSRLSGQSHEVRAFFKDDDITDLPIASCKKMYTLPSIPISFDTLILRGQYTVSKEIGGDKTLQLKWSRPVCRECEEKGMGCRLKNNGNESETECFPKHAKGIIVFWADSVPGIMRKKKKKKKKKHHVIHHVKDVMYVELL